MESGTCAHGLWMVVSTNPSGRVTSPAMRNAAGPGLGRNLKPVKHSPEKSWGKSLVKLIAHRWISTPSSALSVRNLESTGSPTTFLRQLLSMPVLWAPTSPLMWLSARTMKASHCREPLLAAVTQMPFWMLLALAEEV